MSYYLYHVFIVHIIYIYIIFIIVIKINKDTFQEMFSYFYNISILLVQFLLFIQYFNFIGRVF